MGTHPIFESDFDCLTEMELRDWLNTFKSLPQAKLDEYAKQYQNDEPFVRQISNKIVLEFETKEQNRSSITSQLNSFITSRNGNLCAFCLRLCPSLLIFYQESVMSGAVDYEFEILLLQIHNHFLSQIQTAAIPRLSLSSIYHDSVHLSDSLLELKGGSMKTGVPLGSSPLTQICSGNRPTL